MHELILGGARSGKSTLAQGLAGDSGLAVTVVATAEPGDPEMVARIAAHRAARPEAWKVVEKPLALAATLAHHAGADTCLLVDCLTLWLSNLLLLEDEARLRAEQEALLDCLPRLPGRVLLVSNEVGQGVVPADPLARRFRDLAGRLHQALAARCGRVVFVVAGLPRVLKGPPLP